MYTLLPGTPCTDCTPGPTSALIAVHGDGALGSRLRYTLGERLIEASLLPKV